MAGHANEKTPGAKPIEGTPRAPSVQVGVLLKHLEDAKPRDSAHCWVAEAIKDRLPHVRYVSVDLQTIRFTDHSKGFRYVYLTPRSVQTGLLEFDQGKEVEPFTFKLAYGAVHVSGWGNRKGKDGHKYKKPRLVKGARAAKNGKNGIPLQVLGGKTPPISGFSRRREFGLRLYAK